MKDANKTGDMDDCFDMEVQLMKKCKKKKNQLNNAEIRDVRKKILMNSMVGSMEKKYDT